ncbi:MAG: hypothetical protein KGI52_10250, partial [Burkholderiales bacterium]|nr:hypothetical protein [Burkholderiales bacterium]
MTTVAAWLWGWAGLGLALSGWASAGIGYLARQQFEPAPDQPGSTRPPDPTLVMSTEEDLARERLAAAERWLALSRDIADAAQSAPTLAEALHRVGQALHSHIGSRSWICLRVDGWNKESALLRPWIDAGKDTGDLIDVSAIAATHRDERPLGQALATLRPTVGSVSTQTAANCPWRAPQTRRVLAVPVSVDGWPLALLEFDDPSQITHELTPVLDIAAIQLGFVAQRDANRAHMANSAEHLGRLTLVASRISSGVALTDRDGTVEWVNAAFSTLTGWAEDKVIGR